MTGLVVNHLNYHDKSGCCYTTLGMAEETIRLGVSQSFSSHNCDNPTKPRPKGLALLGAERLVYLQGRECLLERGAEVVGCSIEETM